VTDRTDAGDSGDAGDTGDTVTGLLRAAAARDPAGTWLRTDDGTLSFAGAAARVAVFAERLRDAGVRRGDLVVITARSTPPYLLTLLATTVLGAIAVPTNPAATAAELAGLLAQARPRLLASDAGLAATLDEATSHEGAGAELGTVDVTEFAGSWDAETPASVPDLPDTARPDDVAVLIPTSGTTGRSKLVMQTHRAYAWAGEGFPAWMELTADDVLMTSLPLFHINAQAYSTMGSLSVGAGLVLLPKFSASRFLDAARRHGATEFNAIGAMLEILMRQPERPDDADTALRLVYTGPSPTRERQEEMERRFGLRIVCGYAMSETPYGLIWPRGTRPFGTLGAVRQHPRLGVVNEARVVDEAGADAPVGGTGELLLRNPVVTPGYWGMPDETAEVLQDGWLSTGDLVTVNDDDTFTFLSRRKEVLRRRGENLSPLEVEEAVAAHPAVQEVAVVGVPSDLSEEEIKAFVVLADSRDFTGTPDDLAALRDWTAARLSAFKVPRYWQVVPELPRTATARIAKHRLPPGHPVDEYDAEAGAGTRAAQDVPPGPGSPEGAG
jgi:crotonobetaine/carnitine-CoA ligase